MIARIITLILAVWRNRTDFYFAAVILALHLWLQIFVNADLIIV